MNISRSVIFEAKPKL